MKADRNVPCYHCNRVIVPGEERVVRRYGTYHKTCWDYLIGTAARVQADIQRAEEGRNT